MRKIWLFLCCLLVSVSLAAASVHGVTGNVLRRLADEHDDSYICKMRETELLKELTPAERQCFANDSLTFSLITGCEVYVAWPKGRKPLPFWLNERGFSLCKQELTAGKKAYSMWMKKFPAGKVGLGIDSFRNHRGLSYFTIVKPIDGKSTCPVKNPRKTFSAPKPVPLKAGAKIYCDAKTRLTAVPADLAGAWLIPGRYRHWGVSWIIGIHRQTRFPSGPEPDQIMLLITENPCRKLVLSWRTGPDVKNGIVELREEKAGTVRKIKPESKKCYTPIIVNDPVNIRYNAVLDNLKPDTAYTYRIGFSKEAWTREYRFRTPSDKPDTFDFIYLGDTQTGENIFPNLLKRALKITPHPDFIIIAGDLVEMGNRRDYWDAFFSAAGDTFARFPLIPALGNHEYIGPRREFIPRNYLDIFRLPPNSIRGKNDYAYTFSYSNLAVAVLDGNLWNAKYIAAQGRMMDRFFSKHETDWKFAVWHQPVFRSRPGRKREKTALWAPMIDKHKVKIVFQGHDHAYLRTKPVKNGAVQNGGAYYVVSYASSKVYPHGKCAVSAVSFGNVPTIQVIRCLKNTRKILYTALDADGNIRDQFSTD